MTVNFTQTFLTYKKFKSLNLNYKPAIAYNTLGRKTFLSSRISISNKKFFNIDYWYFNFCKSTKTFLILDLISTPTKQIGIYLGLTGPLKGYLRYFPLTMYQVKGDLCNFTNENKNFNKGNIYQLEDLPLGAIIHHLERKPQGGAVFARQHSTFCMIVDQLKKKSLIKLPSSNQIMLSNKCFCILGLNASKHSDIINKLKKAGNLKLLGRKPKVRGVAKNAVDHPHGGGEGKSRIGRAFLCTPFGKNNKGKKTRKKWKV